MAIADNTITDTELKRALTEIDILLKRRQAFWEVPKGIATVFAAAAVFLGFVLAASTWLHPSPQQISVHLDQPLQVQIGPSR